MPEKMNATQFKAQCLAVLDEVARTRRTVTITKRGRDVACIVPVAAACAEERALVGSVLWSEDIVGPFHEEWTDPT